MARKTKAKQTAKSRIKVKDLSASGRRLTGKEMKKVKAGFSGGVRVAVADINEDRRNDLIVPGPPTK